MTKKQPIKPLTRVQAQEDVDQLDAIRKDFIRMKLRSLDLLIGLTDKIKAEAYPREDLCDLGWLCRELESLLDELRKEFAARKDLAGRLIAFRMTQEVIEDPSKIAEHGMTVRGRFSSGSPDVSQSAAVPRRGSKEYADLCKHFGIQGEVSESGIVDFSFTRLAEYVSSRVASGEKLPSGILRTYPVYKTTFRTNRKKKDS